jgi:hypothetical protein
MWIATELTLTFAVLTGLTAIRFLPYTVNFHVNDPRRASRRSSKHGFKPIPSVSSTGGVSLFQRPNGPNKSVPTPGATTEHERVFSPDFPIAEAREGAVDDSDVNVLTESESDSPAWGFASSFNQPRPRAAFSASPSVLKHQEPLVPAAEPLRAASTRETKPTDAKYPTARRLTRSRHASFSKAEWTIEKAEQGNGGLRNAVRSATDAGQLNDKTWIGTLGMPTDSLTPYTKAAIAENLKEEYGSSTVYVSDADFDGHYTHFCKTILWPVFHYQIPDNPKSKAYEDHSWVYYVKINEAFAEQIAKEYKPGDSIWIQDYHLLLLPAMLRKLLPEAQIGIFLHIAFPSSEVFRCLAPRKELLEGMLGANLIGFQTDEYCRHFLQTCSRILCVEATNEGLQLEDRFVNVGTFPIGIDPTSWDNRRQSTDVEQWIKTVSKRYEGKRLIVSRDKIDQVRGIRQKLLSYELFLGTYPEWRDQVRLYVEVEENMLTCSGCFGASGDQHDRAAGA